MKNTKRLSTKAKPFGLTLLTKDEASKVNGGVFGLIFPVAGPVHGLVTRPGIGS
jgi:hypothetical protein